jgi:uncharacterized 2Fe-2S/4Fe-4S cluster protein (DUF4445 family)
MLDSGNRKTLRRFEVDRIRPLKNKIMAALQCGDASPARQEIDQLVDTYLNRIEEYAEPMGWFASVPVRELFPVSIPVVLRECSSVYLCWVSLGNKVDILIQQQFDKDNYIDGVVLDAVSIQMLFRLAGEMYDEISKHANAAGLGLTCRLTPGETAGLELEIQAEIVNFAQKMGGAGISVTEGAMLVPVKSLAFLYGADKSLTTSGTDHDCSLCGKADCVMRTVEKIEKAVVLTIHDGNSRREVSAVIGRRVIDVLRENGAYVNAPCGGRGVCGKCGIEILKGRLLETGKEGLPSRYVEAGTVSLACGSELIEACSIDIQSSTEQGFLGLSDFAFSEAGSIETGFETVKITPTADLWSAGGSVTDAINSVAGRKLTYSLKALRQVSVWVGESLRQDYSGPGPESPVFMILRNNRAVHATADETPVIFGIGIDIGTTTIAFSLIDLVTGAIMKSTSVLNSQRQFGADVISRIQKGTEGYGEKLRDCVRLDISRGISELCGTGQDAVVQMVIAGNTTMLHLLMWMRGDSMALYPFNPTTVDRIETTTADLFGSFPVDCDVTILPSLGAYIGADIVAGMICCGMDKASGISLFIDVGTNGEMAIGNKDKLLCASTAAGPAFEGANITWGTGSVPGAISSVKLKGDEVVFRTIGNVPPVGICGTAVVDIVASCLKEGKIDSTGLFVTQGDDRELRIVKNSVGEWISFTQKDVREFQLAKSAIRSGLEILLKEFGCRWDDVEQVYLAGGFGAMMDVGNAIEVGLFPRELQNKIRSVGNTALGGTIQYMLYSERREAMESLNRIATIVDLSRHPAFNDLFMEQLHFEGVV